MAVGALRVYLGAAPGVGKTYAMLSEGQRRRERGTDVVIGALVRHPRQAIANLAATLEDRSLGSELDVAALLQRRPALALIDDLAGPPSPTGNSERRCDDVQRLLDAGIDVITTINIDELASLRDVATRITGSAPPRSVPDAFVQRAEQVELVDMDPQALRRRLAHGNVFLPERVTAELAARFRVATLTALRELALTWLADRVEESLSSGTEDADAPDLDAPLIGAPLIGVRERIVVAVTGAPGGDEVVRRAARLAARGRATLTGVHVVPEDGLSTRAGFDLEHHRTLLQELGGTYHEVIGDDIASALVSFARAQPATQIVLGASRRTRWEHVRRGSVVADLLRDAGGLDVHVIAPRRSAPTKAALLRTRQAPRSALSPGRMVSAWVLALVGLPLLTLTLLQFPAHVTLSAVLLIFVSIVFAIAAVGGRGPGIAAAMVASALSNWYFVPPRHTLTVAGTDNLVALVVFLAAGATVSSLVDRIATRSREALRARAEAEVLARATATLVGESDPMDHLVEQLCSAFSADGVALLRLHEGSWVTEASAGQSVPARPADGTSVELKEHGDHVLVLSGVSLSADDHRVLRTMASQLSIALETRRLQENSARAEALGEADALRTALLQAVSHDLRTPLASIKVSTSSLLSDDVPWTAEQRRELTVAVDEEADRLNRLVGNLLDMSRLQTGAFRVNLQHVGMDDVVASALASISRLPDNVREDIDPQAVALADPSLLERSVANLVSNSLAWSPPGATVGIEAAMVGGQVHLRVVDHGPGIPAADRARAFEPFQRLGDRSTGPGVGLGLAVARGFVHAMGGRLELDDTPAGGLTVTIVLPGVS